MHCKYANIVSGFFFDFQTSKIKHTNQTAAVPAQEEVSRSKVADFLWFVPWDTRGRFCRDRVNNNALNIKTSQQEPETTGHWFAIWQWRGSSERQCSSAAFVNVDIKAQPLQLDWPYIAGWAYASIFAVAVWFQIRDQFWVPWPKIHEACMYFGFFSSKSRNMSSYGRKWCFFGNFSKNSIVLR